MQKYLSNLALYLLNQEATKKDLHPKEGTFMYKYPRSQKYSLLNYETHRAIVTLVLSTKDAPYFVYHN